MNTSTPTQTQTPTDTRTQSRRFTAMVAGAVFACAPFAVPAASASTHVPPEVHYRGTFRQMEWRATVRRILIFLVALASAGAMATSPAVGVSPNGAVTVTKFNLQGTSFVGYQPGETPDGAQATLVQLYTGTNEDGKTVVTYSKDFYDYATGKQWALIGTAVPSIHKIKSDLSTGRIVATIPLQRYEYDTGTFVGSAGSIYVDDVFTATAPESEPAGKFEYHFPGLVMIRTSDRSTNRFGFASGTVPFDDGNAYTVHFGITSITVQRNG